MIKATETSYYSLELVEKRIEEYTVVVEQEEVERDETGGTGAERDGNAVRAAGTCTSEGGRAHHLVEQR